MIGFCAYCEQDAETLLKALRALLADVDFQSKAEKQARRLLREYDGQESREESHG